MSEIRTESVPLTDGSELRLTIADPQGTTRGGVVVLHEARGVTEAVRQLVSGLAGEGWLAVAPHLYHREDADELNDQSTDDEVADQVGRLDSEQIMDDCDTAFGWLADHEIPSDRMGVLGFDLGGTVALLVAAKRSFGAAVTVAGEGIEKSPSPSVPALVDAAPELTCPWLGVYSESADNGAVERLREAALGSSAATNVVVYPSRGYRFDDDPESGADAWNRVLNWFDSHLR
ncbi:MAG: dienelactone hydrolase family protein [Actinomycetota bacterium]|nr:dienelactone hydrolase family protein [Actinomycetota bacterium]